MTTVKVFSAVKREKLRKAERLEKRQKLRDALPVLDRSQIRRVRINYCDALILDLEEAGFVSSSGFLKQLIQYQADLIREHGPDSLVSSRPRLVDSRDQLDLLYDKLQSAERSHYANDVGNECDELINLGVMFALGSEDWWWLGEQLLMQAVNVSSTYQKDGGRKEAISRYIFGKFLLENVLDGKRAQVELVEARHQTTGKTWTAMREMGQKQDTIFVESCKLLYKALLADAKDIMKYDPLKASRICAIARNRAYDACDHECEANAFMLQGRCEMAADDANAAVLSFGKVLTYHIKVHGIEGVCEARLHLAFAYLRIGYVEKILHQLETVLSFAEEYDLPYYVGQALRCLGEHYLNQGNPKVATPLLIRSLSIFHEIQDRENLTQAMNLAAVSAGQELIDKYTQLILKCDMHDEKQDSLMKLVKWKNNREMFCSEDKQQSTDNWSEDKQQSTDNSLEKSTGSVSTKSEVEFIDEQSEQSEQSENIMSEEMEIIEETTTEEEN